MGVAFRDILGDYKEPVSWESLAGTGALDAHNAIYQFLSIIMNASIYKDEYAERGYRPELLSRSTEDSATFTSVLVPWTACGMTQSTVLGIPTLVYLPFCFFNIISPLMSCLVAILGFVPKPQPKEDQTRVTDDDKDSIG